MKNKYIIFFLIIYLGVYFLLSCDHTDPEVRKINKDYTLLTSHGEISLIHSADDGEIIRKNFVAYCVVGNTIILCEDSSGKYTIYTVDMNTKELTCDKSYSEILEEKEITTIDWEIIWIPISEFDADEVIRQCW